MKSAGVGIDLGTTNSALALAGEALRPLEITQAVSPNALGEELLLPSALYLPLAGEQIAPLPWVQQSVIGRFARDRGALLPERLVSSAKSWLSSEHIDRKSPVLPWQSALGAQKISPFAAAREYLSHLRCNLEYRLQGEPRLDDCEVVVTVPASFNDVARALTHEAALAAGFNGVVLLEEPLAAFYSWLAALGDEWRKSVCRGDLILVVDVGGGTADFSLIAVDESAGALELRRVAVGDHILLGGDNMDLALAYALLGKIEAAGFALDQWQFLSLVHAARQAKERLFSEPDLAQVPLSVPSRSSSLFARTISTSLTRTQAETVILEGFLPLTAADEVPALGRSLGLQEFGLDYAADPALSRHLARFLSRAAQSLGERSASGIVRPTKILFNGGVFNAALLRARVLKLLESWGSAPVELTNSGLDLAVARGAAYYARLRARGMGLRIRAGAPQACYIGVESSMPAVPGIKPPVRGVCILAQGTDEGSETTLSEREFGLMTGEEVQFRFFSSNSRPLDRVGTSVDTTELEEISSIRLAVPSRSGQTGEVLPVRLHAVFTEVGTLELWMQHEPSGEKWRLEYNLRAAAHEPL